MNPDQKINPDDVKTASQEAEMLIKEMERQNGSPDPAFSALQVAIAQYEQTEGNVEELIPAGLGGHGLGWGLFKKGRKGEGFFLSLLSGIKDEICDEKGDLRKTISDGAKQGVTALITAIVATVALPFAFIPPIAALLVSKGIDYWCKRVNEG